MRFHHDKHAAGSEPVASQKLDLFSDRVDNGMLSYDELPDMEAIRRFPLSDAEFKRESKNRMAGILDCLRIMLDEGLPDQKYVDFIALKTHSPSISVEAVRKRLKDA